jgi:hypothetical protein
MAGALSHIVIFRSPNAAAAIGTVSAASRIFVIPSLRGILTT